VIGRTALLITAAILVAGAGAVGSVLLFGGRDGEPPLTPYELEVKAAITRHNDVTARWNDFLDGFDQAEPDAIDVFYVRYQEAADLTEVLVLNGQAIISDWSRLEPPSEMSEAHGLVLDAMKATKDGFIWIERYFRSTVLEGFPTDTLVERGKAKLEEAAGLWQQVRAAGG